VNPVLAALVGLVVLGQRLAILDWTAILVIVSANAVAVMFAVPEVHSKDGDALHHNPVPVARCDVLHGVPDVAVTPAFGKVSADGEPMTSRVTQ